MSAAPMNSVKLFNIDKAVEENDVLVYPIVTGDALEAKAIGFLLRLEQRLGCVAPRIM